MSFSRLARLTLFAAVAAAPACDTDPVNPAPVAPETSVAAAVQSGPVTFDALSSSYACTVSGGNGEQPFALPVGLTQTVIARQGDGGSLSNGDMNTLNETGPQAGRYLYRPTELGSNAQVLVTDLWTGETRVLAQDPSFGSMDGSAWTPWGTLLLGEERSGGRVIEMDPETGAWETRAAVGLGKQEGMRFDALGNFYRISENGNGHIFRFVPDRRGDLTSGQLYALVVHGGSPDRVGDADWVALDLAAHGDDADAAASAVGAAEYGRPEDIEIGTATGNGRGQTLFVAVTSESRVLAIDLREPSGGAASEHAFVWDYVRAGMNVDDQFEWPDNLALDPAGNLFMAEDPGSSFSGGKRRGDDIWMAAPPVGGGHQPAASVSRFASLTDCDAEPTGIYFDRSGKTLYVSAQHRGGDGIDLLMAITGMK